MEKQRRSQRRIEGAAKLLHASWTIRLENEGVQSRKAHWGEELMQPWNQLSERAKEWNYDAIRDFDAIEELLDEGEQ